LNLDCFSIANSFIHRYTFEKYYNGSVDVPMQTSGTELRNLYSLVRQNAQCFTDGLLNGDRVGNLLFFNDVKKNFGKVFEKDISEAVANLELLSDELENYDFKEEDQAIKDQMKKVKELDKEVDNLEDQFDDRMRELSSKKRAFERLSRNARKFMDARDDNDVDKMRRFHERLDENELQALKELDEFNNANAAMRDMIDYKKEDLIRAQGQIGRLEDNKRMSRNQIENAKQSLKSVKNNFWAPHTETIANKTRKEVLNNIKTLSSITNHSFFRTRTNSRLEKLRNFENKMERYLHNLDPQCMDFL